MMIKQKNNIWKVSSHYLNFHILITYFFSSFFEVVLVSFSLVNWCLTNQFLNFCHGGIMGRLITASVDVQFVLCEVLLSTEDYCCPIRDIELDKVGSVLPVLSHNWEKDILCGGQSIETTEFSGIWIEQHHMVTSESSSNTIMLIALKILVLNMCIKIIGVCDLT